MIYDLHIHTTNSDGKYTKYEIIKQAKKLKMEYICFTDHDYISDNSSTNCSYDSYINIINGVEFTVNDYKNMHILGYGIKNIALVKNILDKIQIENIELCKRIICNLNNYYNFNLNIDEYPNCNITKGLIRRMIVDKGIEDNILIAGIKYTGEKSKFYEKNKALNLKEIINLIKESGGISVLAHPSTLRLDNNSLEQLIKDLIYLGLDGIEILNTSKTNNEQMIFYNSLADKYNLYTSCGSDYHDESQILGVENNCSKRLIKKIMEG